MTVHPNDSTVMFPSLDKRHGDGILIASICIDKSFLSLLYFFIANLFEALKNYTQLIWAW